jgi:hypothetical protein
MKSAKLTVLHRRKGRWHEMGAFGMLLVIIFLMLAFGVCLPNKDESPWFALGFIFCIAAAGGILGALKG